MPVAVVLEVMVQEEEAVAAGEKAEVQAPALGMDMTTAPDMVKVLVAGVPEDMAEVSEAAVVVKALDTGLVIAMDPAMVLALTAHKVEAMEVVERGGGVGGMGSGSGSGSAYGSGYGSGYGGGGGGNGHY
ncbi:hypothetical protein BHM03_00059538 [Ensete ventricosum]|nr:hypothetical protein BHM03_00059538 [Ensete ventricosum]